MDDPSGAASGQLLCTRAHIQLLMTSSPRSSESADVVDPPGIPAARRCGGGGGEIPARLRQAGAWEKWRREAATRERERWAAPLVRLPLSFYRQGAVATLFPRW